MGDVESLVRDLRRLDASREVIRQLQDEIRKPVPGVRKAIRARALATLPRRGGLGAWVAKASVTAQVRVGSRALVVKLRSGRKNAKGRADLRRMDAGRTRHPSFGRRGAGQWHTQAVAPGYFTGPAAEVDQWRDAAVAAVENTVERLCSGR